MSWCLDVLWRYSLCKQIHFWGSSDLCGTAAHGVDGRAHSGGGLVVKDHLGRQLHSKLTIELHCGHDGREGVPTDVEEIVIGAWTEEKWTMEGMR